MKQIKSKYHLGQALLIPLVLGVFLLAVSALLFWGAWTDPSIPDPIRQSLGGFFLLLMAIGVFYLTFRYAIRFSIRSEGIAIHNAYGTQEIPWTEIRAIRVTGKESILGQEDEASSITLKDGKKYVFFARYYRNMGTLRRALQLAQRRRKQPTIDLSTIQSNPEPKRVAVYDFLRLKDFRGWHFAKAEALVVYGIGIALLGFWWQNGLPATTGVIAILVFYFVLYWLFLGRQLFYFQTDDQHLVIRYHLWPWWYQAYALKDLEEVVLEQPYRSAVGLRVIDRYFNSQLFLGLSLDRKTWHRLSSDLAEKGLKVRGEI